MSGSIAKNLYNQLDYIIPSMLYLTIYISKLHVIVHLCIVIIFISIEIKDLASDFDNDWKLINIQIGSKL